MTFLSMLSPDVDPGDGRGGPPFDAIARLIVALAVIVGGGLLLMQPSKVVGPEAVIGLVAVVIGYYFGVASVQTATYKRGQNAPDRKDGP